MRHSHWRQYHRHEAKQTQDGEQIMQLRITGLALLNMHIPFLEAHLMDIAYFRGRQAEHNWTENSTD